MKFSINKKFHSIYASKIKKKKTNKETDTQAPTKMEELPLSQQEQVTLWKGSEYLCRDTKSK